MTVSNDECNTMIVVMTKATTTGGDLCFFPMGRMSVVVSGSSNKGNPFLVGAATPQQLLLLVLVGRITTAWPWQL